MNPPSQPPQGSLQKYVLTCLAGCAALIVLVPVGLIFVIILFYAEENWRGAHAWEQAKAEIKAQGETIDPASFIPAPVPDAENFGALPYFKVVSVPGGIAGVQMKRFAINESLKGVTDHLSNSSDDSSADDKLPYLGNWQKGLPADSRDFTGRMRAFLKRQQPKITAPQNATPFEIFELGCPVMAELRAAERTHPQCVFPNDIDLREPWKQSFGTEVGVISVDKALVYDAHLAMLGNQTNLALEDFRVGWKFTTGLQKQPFYIANLVANSIIVMQLHLIQQGLGTKAWNDEQLAALDGDLGNIDFLARSRRQINGEIACYSMPMIDFYATHRGRWSKDIGILNTIFGDDDQWRQYAFQATYLLLPRGWFDLAKADEARRKIEELRRIDLVSFRVHPGPDPAQSSDPALRWLDFILLNLGLTKDIEQKVAYTQVQLDEARIACRLERYYLAHHAYPASIEELSTYGSLPHDLLNGQPYHYRLIAPQKYLLYSVGWNQVDDHGDAGNVHTWESPDWTWTNYPDQK